MARNPKSLDYEWLKARLLIEAAEGDRPGSKKQTFDEEHKMQKCETQPMACSCLHSLKARDVGPSAERSP
jgi:hypothetical protein